ncbi:MAG TPA: HNH endonuclease signature motif containing protein [Nevskiaceae bacterium]|nr:HNH endonuclease signature motif containing protein [Nevskiaceae bacterium]
MTRPSCCDRWLRTVLAVATPGTIARIGLQASGTVPVGMHDAGLAHTPEVLFRALRLLRTLVTRPAARLSAEVESRLARIPVTERTREVRERIGQDVYREALLEFWDGRCALSGMRLPPELLRASHAKPWAQASDGERLDPFNGLLLAIRYDALFDKGLIAFADGRCVWIGVAFAGASLSRQRPCYA